MGAMIGMVIMGGFNKPAHTDTEPSAREVESQPLSPPSSSEDDGEADQP